MTETNNPDHSKENLDKIKRAYGVELEARYKLDMTPEAIAEAMSRNLERVLRQLADDLEKLLRRPQGPPQKTCAY